MFDLPFLFFQIFNYSKHWDWKWIVTETYDVLQHRFFFFWPTYQLAWGRHGNNTGLLVVPTAKAKAWQIGRRIDNDDTPLSRRDSQLHRTEIVRACNIIRSHALEFIQVSPSLRLTPSYPSSMLFSGVCKVKHQIEFLHFRDIFERIAKWRRSKFN